MCKVSFATYLALLLLIMQACTSSTIRKDTLIRQKYPYGLLTENPGILKEDDPEINACIAEPEPFSADSISYPYWQCVETSTVFFVCDHSRETQRDRDKIQAHIVLTVTGDNHIQEYLAPRPMDLVDCQAYEQDWKTVSTGEKYVCISGPFIRSREHHLGKQQTSWIFDKFKTRRGCVSYFEGGCDLQYQIENGCDVASRTRNPSG